MLSIKLSIVDFIKLPLDFVQNYGFFHLQKTLIFMVLFDAL